MRTEGVLLKGAPISVLMHGRLHLRDTPHAQQAKKVGAPFTSTLPFAPAWVWEHQQGSSLHAHSFELYV